VSSFIFAFFIYFFMKASFFN